MRPAWASKRRDETEPAILDALLAAGAQVERLDRPVDLLVRFRGKVSLMEIDGITRNRKRDAAQLAFILAWEVPRVATPEAALRVIGALAYHESGDGV